MVIEHYLRLIEKADRIKTDVEKVTMMEVGSMDWKTTIDTIITEIDDLDRRVDERSCIFRGLEE